MKDNERFKAVTPCYSGGGIYIFTGSLANGRYFISSTDMYDIRELDVNPDDYDFCEEVCMAEWQDEQYMEQIGDYEEALMDIENGNDNWVEIEEKMLKFALEN